MNRRKSLRPHSRNAAGSGGIDLFSEDPDFAGLDIAPFGVSGEEQEGRFILKAAPLVALPAEEGNPAVGGGQNLRRKRFADALVFLDITTSFHFVR